MDAEVAVRLPTAAAACARVHPWPSHPPDERSRLIVSTLLEAFDPLMQHRPHGFRTKFRKMARDPFAFYRGTACLFYADVGAGGQYADFDRDWVDEDTARIWIQGDLHAENFGTYLDADGRLVFDVNDFDEAYLGHWTWDLARFAASLALLCWQKALPDEVIDDLVGPLRACLRRTGRALPERARRHGVGADPRHRRGGRARRVAPRQAVDALRDARVDDRRRGLPATLRGRLRRAPAGRRRGRGGGDGLRRLPGDPARHPPRHGHVRRPRRGRSRRASAWAVRACPRTASSSRVSARPWTTTSCCR